jgi:hypothetical protein
LFLLVTGGGEAGFFLGAPDLDLELFDLDDLEPDLDLLYEL